MNSLSRLVLAPVILLISVASFHSDIALEASSGPPEDIVRLSEKWWGVSFDKFPAVADLSYGDYAEGNHPSRSNVKVISPFSKKVNNKWVPKELPPLEFDFTDENGLVEISGFYVGKQNEVVAALTERYGKHNRELGALGMVTYVWDFDKTSLEITSVSFSLYPRKSQQK